MNQEDFRKILATPRTAPGTTAPQLVGQTRSTHNGSSKLNPFKKPPPRIRREGRSDVLERSHVDLGTGFVDRAKERRIAEQHGNSEESGEVKGLDFELLKKVKSGEFVLPKFQPPLPQRYEDSDEEDEESKPMEEEEEEDAILEELLQMEMELKLEQEAMEKEAPQESVDSTEKTEKPAIEAPAVEATKSKFMPVIDAKQLKQLRRERKRRKLAMEAMDRVSEPAAPPPPVPKKTRAELLEQLRQIQAAKMLQTAASPEISLPREEKSPQHEESHAITDIESGLPAPESPPKNPSNPSPFEIENSANAPEPSSTTQSKHVPELSTRRATSPPTLKVGDNMFSDESELSDYQPYSDNSDDEHAITNSKTTKPSSSSTKRDYFNDRDKEQESTSNGPMTFDPAIAAALRKAAALASKRGLPEEDVQEGKKSTRMNLGGTDGVYEFDEDDAYDGEEEDEFAAKKRKRKGKS